MVERDFVVSANVDNHFSDNENKNVQVLSTFNKIAKSTNKDNNDSEHGHNNDFFVRWWE